MPVKDFTLPILNLKGEPTKQGSKDWLMKDMILVALLDEGEQGQYRIRDAVVRVKAAMLAEKLYKNEGEADYTVDELKLIKDRIDLVAPPLPTLRITEYLDAKELKKE